MLYVTARKYLEQVILFLKHNLNEFGKISNKRVLKREKLMKRSPLVRHLVSLLCSVRDREREEGKRLVETLFKHLASEETEKLNKLIIYTLEDKRYANFDNIKLKATEAIKAFTSFLKEHGDKIVGIHQLDDETRTLKPTIKKQSMEDDE